MYCIDGAAPQSREWDGCEDPKQAVDRQSVAHGRQKHRERRDEDCNEQIDRNEFPRVRSRRHHQTSQSQHQHGNIGEGGNRPSFVAAACRSGVDRVRPGTPELQELRDGEAGGWAIRGRSADRAPMQHALVRARTQCASGCGAEDQPRFRGNRDSSWCLHKVRRTSGRCPVCPSARTLRCWQPRSSRRSRRSRRPRGRRRCSCAESRSRR